MIRRTRKTVSAAISPGSSRGPWSCVKFIVFARVEMIVVQTWKCSDKDRTNRETREVRDSVSCEW